jgi:hypothetical protein
MAGLLTAADPRGVVFDNLGVPASIYFHVGGPPPAPRFRA